MRKRAIGLFGGAVAAAAIAATAACNLGEPSVKGGSTGLRTAWGGPSLEGLWAQAYQIPMQRSARDAGKTELTDEEIAQRTADRDKPRPVQPNRGDRVAKRGTLEDLAGAY